MVTTSYSITVTLYVCIVHTVCSSQLHHWESSKLGTLNSSHFCNSRQNFHIARILIDPAINIQEFFTHGRIIGRLQYILITPQRTPILPVSCSSSVLHPAIRLQRKSHDNGGCCSGKCLHRVWTPLLRTTTNFRTTVCNTLSCYPLTTPNELLPLVLTVLRSQNGQNN